MRFLKYPAVAIFLLATHSVFAAGPLPLPIHLDITGLTRAAAPHVVGNYVLFTYPARASVRLVGIAFASQDFRTVHTFYRNQHGVFFYLYPIPPGRSSLVYRIVVDGLWRSDPENPHTITDQSGIALSKFDIPARRQAITKSPIVKPNGEVQFFFKAPSGENVTVAGDFNGWDPFMDPLTRDKNGFYTTTLRIPAGTHAYYFVSNGTPIADPLDPRVDYRPDGTKVSVFTVP